MTTFNLVAIGAPGSGKTVYLSVLHEALGQGALGAGIVVKASASDRSFLHSIYEQVADADSEFPLGTDPTQAMRDFTLSLDVQRLVRQWFREPELISYPAMTLSYIDYAGEWVTEGHRQSGELHSAFQDKLDQAHVLLTFLDSGSILGLMQGKNMRARGLLHSMKPTIDLAASLGKPLVLVLTKWDLVGDMYTLPEVLTFLLQKLPELRAAIQTRSNKFFGRIAGTVWIIPVSSTGSEIVTLDESGEVVKSGRGELHPVNILEPIVVGIRDVSRIALKAQARVPVLADRESEARAIIDAGSKTLNQLAIPVGTTGVSVDLRALVGFVGDATTVVLRVASWPVMWTIYRARGQYRRVRARGLQGVQSEEGALMYLIHLMKRRIKSFESDSTYSSCRVWTDGNDWDVVE